MGFAFSLFELRLATLPVRLFGLMLPLDPLLEFDIGLATVCVIIGVSLEVCPCAFEDERIGTAGPTVPSAAFPCASVDAPDGEADFSAPTTCVADGSWPG